MEEKATDAARHQRFSPRTRNLLMHMARAAMPAGAIVPEPDEDILDRVEAMLAELPPQAGSGLQTMALAFEQLPRLKHGRPFTRLSAEDQLAFMRSLLHGPYPGRQLLRVLCSPLKVARYDDPKLFEHFGATYRTDPVLNEEKPRYLDRAMDADTVDETELQAEVVIVGSGAGGAALAAELAEMGLAVIVVEEGGYFRRPDFTGRPLQMLRRMYRDFGTTGTIGNCWIPVPFGRCVGGTTTINSGTCYRTPDRVLTRWGRELGLDELNPEAMEPHFAKVESVLRVTPADLKYVGGIGTVIARGCERLGYHDHAPLRRNAPDCDGRSLCVFGCPTDAKRSTNVSYMPLALRYGATLLYRATVERILLAGDRAVGISCRTRSGRSLNVRASVVVLSAGSLMSPTLLLRQGLANRSGQVGRNLSIHPAVGVMGIFDDLIKGYTSIPQGYGVEEFHKEGILYEGAFLPVDFGAGGVTLVGPPFTRVMEAMDHMGYFGFLIEDSSRGRVHLAPGGKPVMSYIMNDSDVARLKRGMEILLRIYLAAGASGIFPMVPGFEEIRDMRDVERFRDMRLRARDFELTAHHPLGTCRMGLDPRSSVVGPTHECHDVPGLFIVDGSSVPSSLGVNPQVTIMAMATRAATFVARRAEALTASSA